MKFTDEGTVTTGGRRVAPDRLECIVVNTGIGVGADDPEFIYDEFFQVDAHTSLVYRGAGLGLSLVRDRVLLMEGDMPFSSEAGRGTTVRLTLPVERV